MKLHGLTPVVSLISSAESAEALTLLRSSSYGGAVRRPHPRAYAQGLLRRRIILSFLSRPFQILVRGSSPRSSPKLHCMARLGNWTDKKKRMGGATVYPPPGKALAPPSTPRSFA